MRAHAQKTRWGRGKKEKKKKRGAGRGEVHAHKMGEGERDVRTCTENGGGGREIESVYVSAYLCKQGTESYPKLH